MSATTLRVVKAGPSVTVQDRGRPGWAHLGVGTSGAMDRAAAALAARLVGNPGDAAGLEIIGATELEFDRPVWVAVTGGSGPVVADGRPAPERTPLRVTRLQVGSATVGLRRYLAVRGGLTCPSVLGSRSYDSLARLGPEPLRDGATVPVGPGDGGAVPFHDGRPAPAQRHPLRVWWGPRADWFTPAAAAAFVGRSWQVSARSDRTGIRLDGPVLERQVHRELPSEPMIPGSVQVSPDGHPTVLAVDAPVTGGYPVLAVVDDADLDRLAQPRPGDRLRFRAVG